MIPVQSTDPASGSAAGGDYTIRVLETFESRADAAQLYRTVFDYGREDFSVSPHLLRSLIDNGGSALGAFDETGRIVGFCYGFGAGDGDRRYHYSQATVIALDVQARGLGRRLKRAQADVARASGASAMRWSYDPYLARNAHFNLSSLGARGIRFFTDYYDQPDTDRLIVEWDLTSPDLGASSEVLGRTRKDVTDGVRPFLRSLAPEETKAGTTAGYRWLVFPSEVASRGGTPEADRVRSAIRDSLLDTCGSGLAVLACDRVGDATPGAPDRAVYIFEGH